VNILHDFLIRKGCKPRFTLLKSMTWCEFTCKRECTNKKYKRSYWADKRNGRFAYRVLRTPSTECAGVAIELLMGKNNNSVQLFSLFGNKSKTELYQCFSYLQIHDTE
jgi:hypothetical protein